MVTLSIHYPYTLHCEELRTDPSYSQRRRMHRSNLRKIKLCVATMVLSTLLLQTMSYLAATWPTPVRPRHIPREYMGTSSTNDSEIIDRALRFSATDESPSTSNYSSDVHHKKQNTREFRS
ncbi:hypothetical protein RRG08_010195 [Elysia crispata]|uniref:Uncharacterized protein n=1 Tax=Elysia crispata TaxID=231223 RepID=A0AAE1AKM7_9GAST|nr:hypothetical protein RRG08_010195 [Elysia crispata]